MNGCASLNALLSCPDGRTGLFLIRVYQCTLSPIFVCLAGLSGCRFPPTCSTYFLESVERMVFGAAHGWDYDAWAGASRGVDVGTTRCRCSPPQTHPDGYRAALIVQNLLDIYGSTRMDCNHPLRRWAGRVGEPFCKADTPARRADFRDACTNSPTATPQPTPVGPSPLTTPAPCAAAAASFRPSLKRSRRCATRTSNYALRIAAAHQRGRSAQSHRRKLQAGDPEFAEAHAYRRIG